MIIEYITVCRIIEDALPTRRINVIMASKYRCSSTIGTRNTILIYEWSSGACASAYIDVVLFAGRRLRVIGAAVTNTEERVVISSVEPDVDALDLVGTRWIIGDLILVTRGEDVVPIDSNLSLINIAPI